MWPSDKLMPEFEDFDTTKFCADFLQNKGESLMPVFSLPQQNYDEVMNSDVPNALWPAEDFETDFGAVPLQQQGYCLSLLDNSMPETNLPNTHAGHNPLSLQNTNSDSSSNGELYTVVHNKRRGTCRKCLSECAFYRGEGGPCNECGCFPSQHVDLDVPNNVLSRKRARVQAEEDDEEDEDSDDSRLRKRPRYLLETKFFQKLFFNCLHFMTLEEISLVCSRAPVPLFVKDEASVYIYINLTFCNFIMDVARTERILNKSTSQVLGQSEAVDVVKQEKFLMAHDQGTIKTFNVNIQKQTFKVMKQWTLLKDGKKVIIGAVVSSF